MLMQIGPVAFDLRFNLVGVDHETTRDYAEKPVIGIMPPLEDMGDGPESLSLTGRVIPDRMGGLSSLDVLSNMQKTGLPQLVMRGDGRIMGFFVLLNIRDGHSFLNARGVGQIVDLSIEMRRAEQPSAQDYFAGLWSLLQ